MIKNASRALPMWAVPGLVAMLLAAPMTSRAAEGTDLAPTVRPATAARPSSVPTAATTAQSATGKQPTAKPTTAKPQVQAQARRPTVPAPRPIAAGPVWTDASGAWRQVGIASWYGGPRWQGKLTASGVRYDERQLTAAHASLPIGSVVRVTVVDTGQSVIVTINDRPGTRKRIIDLSRAAAIELGILSRGLAQVTLTPT